MEHVENTGLLTADQVKQILAPYMDGLREDFHAAWAWVQVILDEDPERRTTFDLSTQAAMVFNRFVILNTRRFEANRTVKVRKRGRMMTINFGGGLILRFKKFDHKLRSGNVRTNAQALMYYQLCIEGMEPATFVTFGYQVDETGRNITGVHIACPIGWSRNKWAYPIDEDEAGTLPLAGTTPPAGPLVGGGSAQAEEPGFALEPKGKSKKKKSEGQ